ncbi:Putative transcription termination [Fructilactobacillus florum 8D]|uniref:Ribosome maturation factor RimP n=2 Tax=Fructilactobacillus florum TaxID=640331 RepID=W9EIW2_9LACO|nr:ribosome maturation factor RimP [Fructilactobacillus florum]EKK20220.1 Putative transcription termination [Fructilactobacillus florum 2F]ETO40905.1 Putative transcription termination [Fructilactobacillus florum 8D]KRM91394.1 hypothetical protein FC87_GL000905 [Fructilactobacillus florum DSM 22689 = JCM 16035]
MSEANEIIKQVAAVVTPILQAHQFYLDRIEFVKEAGNWYLRVFIDKDEGITLDDCVLVSDQLGTRLDELVPDPFVDPYFLEVSSPGAERPLLNETDYQHALHRFIHVSLYQKLEQQKEFEGTLMELDADELTLSVKQKGVRQTVVIPRQLVAKARLAIDFSQEESR